MGGLYGFGQGIARLPERAGALARRAFELPGQAEDAFIGAGRTIGQGLREGAMRFGEGVMGAPSFEEQNDEFQRFLHPVSSTFQEGAELEGMYPEPSPPGALGKTLDPMPEPASRGALMAGLEAPMPDFGDVGSGGSSTEENAHVMRTLSGPRREPESYLRVGMGGGPLQDYAPDGPDIGAPGRGTVSMMTAPENANRVTFASQLEDAQNESALRSARGEPSPGDIYRYQQQQALKYGPDERLKIQQANDTRQELGGFLQFQQDIKSAVDSGQMSPQDAEARLTKAREDMALRINALNGQSVGQWGPRPTNFQLPIG